MGRVVQEQISYLVSLDQRQTRVSQLIENNVDNSDTLPKIGRLLFSAYDQTLNK